MQLFYFVFVTLMYQPLFNVLIGFYWLTEIVGMASMGVAVILLTVVVRGLLLPLSLASDRSEAERRRIGREISLLHQQYASQPVVLEKKKRSVLRQNRRVLIGEMLIFFIQLLVALMLWRMFKTGLTGQDVHLIYSFMPEVTQPFHLIFLGKYDLTHPSIVLNSIQAILIFVLEAISIITSPYKVSRKDVIRMQLVLPLVSFVIFLGMPAGKKIFIITTLIISIILTITKATLRFVNNRRESSEKTDLKPAVAT